MQNPEQNAWKRVEDFLSRTNFTGFTKEDLFIKRFVPKGWGQDIAALSNMAEAIHLRSKLENLDNHNAQNLAKAVIDRATHKSVSPYKKSLGSIESLGRYGYYLEHLNIILGMASAVGADDYKPLNLKISRHLAEQSLSQENSHAPLLPHVKMRWSADQAAILHSLWLCDQNHDTDFHKEPATRWIEYMTSKMTHSETGLFETEVMRVKRYSRQPRGCALAYLIHYTSGFAPEIAAQQWASFKEHMYQDQWGLRGFREYLPSYQGKWTPDSGPIIGGIGVAATGLALKAANSVDDEELLKILRKSAGRVIGFLQLTRPIPMLNILTAIGTDVLASAIYSNSKSNPRTRCNGHERVR